MAGIENNRELPSREQPTMRANLSAVVVRRRLARKDVKFVGKATLVVSACETAHGGGAPWKKCWGFEAMANRGLGPLPELLGGPRPPYMAPPIAPPPMKPCSPYSTHVVAIYAQWLQ